MTIYMCGRSHFARQIRKDRKIDRAVNGCNSAVPVVIHIDNDDDDDDYDEKDDCYNDERR